MMIKLGKLFSFTLQEKINKHVRKIIFFIKLVLLNFN